MKSIRILVADAQGLVADGIAARLAINANYIIVGHAPSGLVLMDLLSKLNPDLVLMDISLHDMDGIDTMRRLHRECPWLKVLAHSALTNVEYVNSMLVEGASGYLLKSDGTAELLTAIETVMAGGSYISANARASIERGYRHTEKHPGGEYVGLTQRERDVIRLIALERTNAEIAGELNVSEDTVKTHRKNLMAKLNVRSIAGLVRYAVDRCWV